MTRIVYIFVIFLINVVTIKDTFCTSVNKEPTIKAVYHSFLYNIGLINNMLNEIPQRTSSAAVIGSLYDQSSSTTTDDKFFKVFIKHAEVIRAIDHQYEATRDYKNNVTMKSWFTNLLKDNILHYELDILKNAQPIIMALVTENFKRDVEKYSNSLSNNFNSPCKKYISLRDNYYIIIWNLIIIDMKIVSIYVYDSSIAMPNFKKELVYGLDGHLTRIRALIDTALNLGKNIPQLLSRCEQLILITKFKSMFQHWHMSYEDDWTNVKAMIELLKN